MLTNAIITALLSITEHETNAFAGNAGASLDIRGGSTDSESFAESGVFGEFILRTPLNGVYSNNKERVILTYQPSFFAGVGLRESLPQIEHAANANFSTTRIKHTIITFDQSLSLGKQDFVSLTFKDIDDLTIATVQIDPLPQFDRLDAILATTQFNISYTPNKSTKLLTFITNQLQSAVNPDELDQLPLQIAPNLGSRLDLSFGKFDTVGLEAAIQGNIFGDSASVAVGDIFNDLSAAGTVRLGGAYRHAFGRAFRAELTASGNFGLAYDAVGETITIFTLPTARLILDYQSLIGTNPIAFSLSTGVDSLVDRRKNAPVITPRLVLVGTFNWLITDRITTSFFTSLGQNLTSQRDGDFALVVNEYFVSAQADISFALTQTLALRFGWQSLGQGQTLGIAKETLPYFRSLQNQHTFNMNLVWSDPTFGIRQ